MRRISSAAAVLLLLVAGALAVGTTQASYHEDDGGDGGGTNQTAGDGGPDGDGDGSRTRDGDGDRARGDGDRARAMARARQAGLFGSLSYSNGTAWGDFVTLDVDEDTGEVRNLTLLDRSDGDVQVFEALTPADFEPRFADEGGPESTRPGAGDKQTVRAHGSQLTVEGEQTRLRAHDNPTGLLQIWAAEEGEGQNVSIELAPQVEPGEVRNGSMLPLEIGTESARLILAGNGTLSGGANASADLEPGDSLLFRATPPGASGEAREQDRAISRAIADDRLGASLRMAGVNGTAVGDAMNLTANASAIEAVHGRARVEVSAEQSQARVLHLLLDRATLDVADAEDAVLRLDGENVSMVDEVAEVVNATGNESAAHVFASDGQVEITVRVPAFSTRTVVAKEAGRGLPDVPEPAGAHNPVGRPTSLAQMSSESMSQRARSWEDLPAQARENAAEQASEARLFGALGGADGVSGEFVSAEMAGRGVNMSDLQVDVGEGDESQTVRYVERLGVEPHGQASLERHEAGPTLGLETDELVVQVHDTPTGTVEIEAGDRMVNATLELPEDADARRLSKNHVRWETNGSHAHLSVASGNGEIVLEHERVRVVLGSNAQALVAAHPQTNSVAVSGLDDRMEAIDRGVHGGKVAVASSGNEAVRQVEATTVVVEDARARENESVNVTLASEIDHAQMVEVDVPKETLDVATVDRVEVRVDGETVDEAGLAGDVYAQASTGRQVAHVSEEAEAIQVLVNLDGFSERNLTVGSTDGGDGGGDDNVTDGDGEADGDGEQDGAPGARLAGIVAALALAGALARRGRERGAS